MNHFVMVSPFRKIFKIMIKKIKKNIKKFHKFKKD